MNIKKIVGINLKNARKKLKISQKILANELNKNQQNYSQYEMGQIELDYEKIIYLCQKLKITPNELFSWKEIE